MEDEIGFEAVSEGPTGKWAKVLRTLFSALFFFFQLPEKYQQPSSARHLLPVVLAVLEASHMASLLLSEVRTTGFSSVVKATVSFIRYDTIAAYFGLLLHFVVAHMALALIALGSIAVKMAYPHRGGAALKIVGAEITRYFLYIGFVPVLVGFETYIWFWLIGSQGTYSSSSQLPYSTLLGPLCLCCLPLVALLQSLCVFFDYSLVYNPTELYLHDRTHAFEFFCHVASRFVIITAYITLEEKQLMWIEVLFVLSGIANGLLMAATIPFFSQLTNALFVWKDVMLAWTTLAVLIGYAVESDLVPILLFGLIAPFIFVLVYCDIGRRLSAGMEGRRRKDTLVKLDLAYRGEVRITLKSEFVDTTRIHHLFAEMRKTNRAELCLMEAAFYLIHVKDRESARKSFARFSWSSPSVEMQFQRFRIEKSAPPEEDKELKYMNMMDATARLKEQDSDLCYKLYLFLQELSAANCQVRKCEKLAEQISHSAKELMKDCRSALSSFPRSSHLLALYGSLLEDVLCDVNGRVYKEKAKGISETSVHKLESVDAAHFFESVAVLCISAGIASLGQVSFMNEVATRSFGSATRETGILQVGQVLPHALAVYAHEVMESVVMNGMSIGHLVRLFSFLLDTQQFCLLSKVQVKLIDWQDRPHFFVSVLPDPEKKAELLFNANLVVLCHSDNLFVFTNGPEGTNYRQSYLLDVFPFIPANITEYESGMKVPFCGGSSLVTLFEHIKIGPKTFYSLSILTPERERAINRRVTVHRSFNHLLRLKDSKIVRFDRENEYTSSLNVVEESYEVRGERLRRSSTDKLFPVETHGKLPASTSALSVVSGTSSSTTQQGKTSDKFSADAQRCATRLKVFLFLSILLVLAMFVAMTVFVVDAVKRLQEVNVIRDMSQRRHLEVDMADVVRRMQLSAAGHDSTPQSALRDRIIGDIANYTAAVNLIKDKIGMWQNGRNREMYFEDITPIFEQREGKVFSSFGDLFKVMYNLLYHAGVVANAMQDNNTADSQYYLLRNAPAESFNFINRSMFLFVEDETTLREKNFNIAEGLRVGAVLTLVFCSLCLIVPQVVLLEQKHRSIWRILLSLSFDNIVDAKQRLLERMRNLHGLELPELGFTAKRSGAIGRLPRAWGMLTLKLSVLLVCVTVFWAVMGYEIYPQLKAELKTMPNYLNWAGLRSSDIYEINFWLREVQLEHTDWSSSALFRMNSYWPDAYLNLQRCSASLHFIMSLLTNANPQYHIYVQQDELIYKEYRFKSACAQGNPLLDCSDKPEEYGLFYALSDYLQAARDYGAVAQHGTLPWLEIEEFERMKQDLFVTATHGVHIYEMQMEGIIDQFQLQLLLCLSLLGALMVASYFCCYVHIVARAGTRLTDRAFLYRMVAGS